MRYLSTVHALLFVTTLTAITAAIPSWAVFGESVEILPTTFDPTQYPGTLIFEGDYRHKSRGHFFPDTTHLWLKQQLDGALIAIAENPYQSSKDITFGNAGNDLVEYRSFKLSDKASPGWASRLQFKDGKLLRSRVHMRTDEVSREIPVPEGSFDPNTRPDSYCAANILLRKYGLAGAGPKEFPVYDVDNSGDGYSPYRIKIEGVGKEKIETPAGRFEANHVVQTQLTRGDTWYKKYPGLVTDFWVLDNGILIKIVRRREPYELELVRFSAPSDLPGVIEKSVADMPSQPSPATLMAAQAKRPMPDVPPTLEFDVRAAVPGSTRAAPQDTGLLLEPGDELTFAASGVVTKGGGAEIRYGPNGAAKKAEQNAELLLPHVAHMALVGQAGDRLIEGVLNESGKGLYGSGFVGERCKCTITGDASANLFLAVNDGNQAGNWGTYHARIWIVRKGLILPPAAQPATAPAQATGRITGRVTSSDGNRPLAGARVTAMLKEVATVRVQASSGADGAYAINDLVPGAYTVLCAPPPGIRPTGERHEVQVEQCLPATTTKLEILRACHGAGDRWRDVTGLVSERVRDNGLSLPVGELASEDPAYGVLKILQVHYKLGGAVTVKYARDNENLLINVGAPPVNFQFDKTSRVTGRVTDTDGNPIAGAKINAHSERAADKAVTDSKGGYALLGMPYRGSFVIAAAADGFYSAEIQIPDGQGDVRDANFYLAKEAVIKGRVVDTLGQPLPGGELYVTSDANTLVSRPGQMTPKPGYLMPKVDSSGCFTVTGLAPGDYQFERIVESDQHNYRQEAVGPPLHVPGGKKVDAEIIFDPPEASTIAGCVRDADGKGIAGVRVDGCTYEGLHWIAVTDDAGRYRLLGTAGRSFDLRFSKDGCPGVMLKSIKADTVNADITIPRTGIVRAKIVDADTGAPIRDADGHIQDFQPELVAPSENHGQFAAGSIPGEYTVTQLLPGTVSSCVTAKEYQKTLVSDIAVKAGKITDLVVRLRRGAVIEGAVLSGGKPIARAEQFIGVKCLSDPAREIPAGYIIHKGRYRLEGLASGKYEVSACARGYGHSDTRSAVVEVKAGKKHQVDFNLDYPQDEPDK